MFSMAISIRKQILILTYNGGHFKKWSLLKQVDNLAKMLGFTGSGRECENFIEEKRQ